MTAMESLHSPVPPSAHTEKSKPLNLLEKKLILPFIIKLSNMVRDSSSAGLIFWSSDGQSLVVLNECLMGPCLDQHYRQRNFISFVRQLHCHGFTKKSMAINAVGLEQRGQPI